MGYRTDICSLNHCADLFVFPSLREGLGLASIEALASGTPVCGMRTRGISEYVIPRETGELFDNNIESCKTAIFKVIGCKKDMRDKCISMAEKYDIENANAIMKSIYRDIN